MSYYSISCLYPLFDQFSVVGLISNRSVYKKLVGVCSSNDPSSSEYWLNKHVGVLFSKDSEVPDVNIRVDDSLSPGGRLRKQLPRGPFDGIFFSYFV